MPDRNGKPAYLILSGIFLVITITITYFTPRYNSLYLITQYSLLFGIYLFFLIRKDDTNAWKIGYFTGIVARISLLFLIPNLSDDVYRFIWDGRLIAEGINPFSHLPTHWLNIAETPNGIDTELHQLFGSKDTYSCYPPVNQFIFWISVVIAGGRISWSVIIIRIFILLAEVGNFRIIPKLLKKYNLPESFGLIWYLNPLVILELTGNLHFEAIVIFFLLSSILYLESNKWVPSAIMMGFAISAKLIPLIFLPLLIRRIGFKKTLLYGLLAATVVILQFIPFLGSDPVIGFKNSLLLYFQNFEFNASIYYLIRQVGFWITGFNIIQIAGPFLAIITFIGIVSFASLEKIRKNNLATSAMWVFMIYVAFTTTLHPWYVTMLLGLSIFSGFRFPIAWSFLIILTYAGYTIDGFNEPYVLIAIEYLVVYGLLLTEIFYSDSKFIAWLQLRS